MSTEERKAEKVENQGLFLDYAEKKMLFKSNGDFEFNSFLRGFSNYSQPQVQHFLSPFDESTVCSFKRMDCPPSESDRLIQIQSDDEFVEITIPIHEVYFNQFLVYKDNPSLEILYRNMLSKENYYRDTNRPIPFSYELLVGRENFLRQDHHRRWYCDFAEKIAHDSKKIVVYFELPESATAIELKIGDDPNQIFDVSHDARFESKLLYRAELLDVKSGNILKFHVSYEMGDSFLPIENRLKSIENYIGILLKYTFLFTAKQGKIISALRDNPEALSCKQISKICREKVETTNDKIKQLQGCGFVKEVDGTYELAEDIKNTLR